MAMVSVPLGLGGLNLDVDATSARDESAVAYYNCYQDRSGAIRSIPGVTLYGTLGTNSDVYPYYSALHNTFFAVSGGRIFYQTAQSGAWTEILGSTLSGANRAVFAEDGDSVFIADKSRIQKINGTTKAISELTAVENVVSLGYIGGYLLAVGDSTVKGDTQYSDDKANNYSAWEVYNNESMPDDIQAVIVAFEQVYNIGLQSLEVSYIDGVTPFAVNKNQMQSIGTLARYSVAFDSESIYYITELSGLRKLVRLVNGGAPQVISMPFDMPLDDIEDISNASGFLMGFRGQNFYVLTFPIANVIINDQSFQQLTVAYHLQKNQWIILGKWDGNNSAFGAYRGISFQRIDQWGLSLIGGSDGKIYQLYDNETVDYIAEPSFSHRWRDNHSATWKLPRTVSLGVAGEYKNPPDQTQGGIYRYRQHEITYSDLTDAGETLRAVVLTGNISHNSPLPKRSLYYRYNVKRGTNQFILNDVAEEVEILRR